VRRCANAGVDIYVDAVINHMTGQARGVGSNGTSYTKYDYPGLYDKNDFHPPCAIVDSDYQTAPSTSRRASWVRTFSLHVFNRRGETSSHVWTCSALFDSPSRQSPGRVKVVLVVEAWIIVLGVARAVAADASRLPRHVVDDGVDVDVDPGVGAATHHIRELGLVPLRLWSSA